MAYARTLSPSSVVRWREHDQVAARFTGSGQRVEHREDGGARHNNGNDDLTGRLNLTTLPSAR